jgi:hypothetical protein
MRSFQAADIIDRIERRRTRLGENAWAIDS